MTNLYRLADWLGEAPDRKMHFVSLGNVSYIAVMRMQHQVASAMRRRTERLIYYTLAQVHRLKSLAVSWSSY